MGGQLGKSHSYCVARVLSYMAGLLANPRGYWVLLKWEFGAFSRGLALGLLPIWSDNSVSRVVAGFLYSEVIAGLGRTRVSLLYGGTASKPAWLLGFALSEIK
jgi:hypothetical protein